MQALSKYQFPLWRLAPRGLALTVAALGGLVLLGWAFDIEILKSIRPGRVAMNPATAVAFIAASIASLCVVTASPRSRWLRTGIVCASLVLLISALRLIGYLTPWDPGIDRVLFASRLGLDGPARNYMAPHTTSAFALCGINILLLTRRSAACGFASITLSVCVAVLAALALVGHANGVVTLFGVSASIGMAIHTSGCFLLLAAAYFLLGWSRLSSSKSPETVTSDNNDRLIVAGIAAASGVMVVVSVTAFASTYQFLNHKRLAEHTREVMSARASLAFHLKEAQASSRGYVITGDPSFRPRYEQAVQSVYRVASLLRELTSDNPSQRVRLGELTPLLEAYLERTQSTIAIRDAEGFESARDRIASGIGPRMMDGLFGKLDEVEGEESSLLVRRNNGAEEGASATVVVVIVGGLFGIVVVVASGLLIRRDLMGRRASERALRDTVSRFERANREILFQRSTLDRAGILSETDVHGTITHANDEFCRISGYSREELVGQNHRMLNSGHHSREFWRDMFKMLTHTGVWQGTVCNRAKDGSLYWVQSTNVAFRDEHNRIVRYVSLRSDVTDRVRAEAELKEREERMRFLSDTMPQIVWTARPDGGLDYYNSRWFEFTGMTFEQTKDWGWKPVIHPDELQSCIDRWSQSVATGESFEGEYRFKRADGEYRWHLCRGLPWRDDRGQVRQWVGTCTDITDAKLAEERARSATAVAEAASGAKSEFLAHMSHEIRTPLNGVVGMTELLLGTELTAQQRRFAQLAKASASGLTTIINDILDFSKIEAGKLEIVETEVAVRQTVEDVVELLAQRAAAKGIEIACHIAPEIPERVMGDPDRLRQVLVNLINNAVKFTERGGVVLRATLDEEGERSVRVRFSITDTGIGIARDHMSRLFKSFSQAETSTTRSYGGTGLGLVISKRLTELMGGQIGVESTPERGSTFWFTVQFRRGSGTVEDKPRLDVRGMRVLAVDDNDVHRETLVQQIASWGLEAAAAEDGPAALNMLRDATRRGLPFKVAMVDRDMPGMNGLELASAIRSRTDIRETVLMILLTVDDDVDHKQLRSMGFSGHVSKPVRQSQLFNAIMEAVATSEAAGQPPPSLSITPVAAGPTVPSAGALPGLSILLAEDNEVNRIVATEILKRFGCRCETVNDGRAAVEAVTARKYDLLLVDCQMPVMDGFEATRDIRRREASTGGHLPIVALTANAMQGDRDRCLEAGMDGYASKPINPKELLAAIQQVIGTWPQARPWSGEAA